MSERQINEERMNVLIGCGFLLTMAALVWVVIMLLVREVTEHGWMYTASIVVTIAVVTEVLYWLLEVWAFGGNDE